MFPKQSEVTVMLRHICAFITLSIFAVLTVTGCTWTQEKAEENAWEWSEETGLDPTNITCNNQDSDDDGYVSCTFTFKTKDGEATTKQYECIGALFTFDSGCREPKLTKGLF